MPAIRVLTPHGGDSAVTPLDQFLIGLAHLRLDALRERRHAEQVVRLGGDRRLGIAEVARRLGDLHPETVRRRMARGHIPGAYLDQGRWQIRLQDLWRYDPRVRDHDEGESAS